MDYRYLFWFLVGAVTYESSYRDFVAIIASAIYFAGVIKDWDATGFSFGLNCIGIWLIIFPSFVYKPLVFDMWVILISINYLLVKKFWGVSDD